MQGFNFPHRWEAAAHSHLVKEMSCHVTISPGKFGSSNTSEYFKNSLALTSIYFPLKG